MNTEFFELFDDLESVNRWHLSGLFDSRGKKLDSRQFTYGKVIDVGPPLRARLFKVGGPLDAWPPLTVELYKDIKGLPLDFTFDTSDAPIVTLRVAEILAKFAAPEIQQIPVQVQSKGNEPYEIINVISMVDCIDKMQSVIEYWETGNPVRPDLAGKPHMIRKLVIDPQRAVGHHLFRLADHSSTLIAAGTVKSAFDQAQITGVKFRKVSA